jgi:hypothetical protein
MAVDICHACYIHAHLFASYSIKTRILTLASSDGDFDDVRRHTADFALVGAAVSFLCLGYRQKAFARCRCRSRFKSDRYLFLSTGDDFGVVAIPRDVLGFRRHTTLQRDCGVLLNCATIGAFDVRRF